MKDIIHQQAIEIDLMLIKQVLSELNPEFKSLYNKMLNKVMNHSPESSLSEFSPHSYNSLKNLSAPDQIHDLLLDELKELVIK